MRPWTRKSAKRATKGCIRRQRHTVVARCSAAVVFLHSEARGLELFERHLAALRVEKDVPVLVAHGRWRLGGWVCGVVMQVKNGGARRSRQRGSVKEEERRICRMSNDYLHTATKQWQVRPVRWKAHGVAGRS